MEGTQKGCMEHGNIEEGHRRRHQQDGPVDVGDLGCIPGCAIDLLCASGYSHIPLSVLPIEIASSQGRVLSHCVFAQHPLLLGPSLSKPL